MCGWEYLSSTASSTRRRLRVRPEDDCVPTSILDCRPPIEPTGCAQDRPRLGPRVAMTGWATLAKVPPGVEVTKYPQVLVLVVATWATCRNASCCRACSTCAAPASFRVAGLSASRWTTSTSRAFARSRVARSIKFLPRGNRKRSRLGRLRRNIGLRADGGGARSSEGGRGKGGADVRRRKSPLALSQRAAGRGVIGRAVAVGGRSRRAVADHHGKSRSARIWRVPKALNAKLRPGSFPGRPDFPHRPFHGQGPAQNILAFRFANGLFELIRKDHQLHRSRADRRYRRRWAWANAARRSTRRPAAYRDARW